MQIAIIGAGNVGRALATSLTRAGHDVTVSAVHPEHARETAAESGATAAANNQEAVSGADLVVLAVPASAFDTLAGELGSQIAGKVVVDVSNRPTPNADGPATSIAEELQTKLPAAKVIKAFNTAFASRQAQPQVRHRGCDARRAGVEQRLRLIEHPIMASRRKRDGCHAGGPRGGDARDAVLDDDAAAGSRAMRGGGEKEEIRRRLAPLDHRRADDAAVEEIEQPCLAQDDVDALLVAR